MNEPESTLGRLPRLANSDPSIVKRSGPAAPAEPPIPQRAAIALPAGFRLH